MKKFRNYCALVFVFLLAFGSCKNNKSELSNNKIEDLGVSEEVYDGLKVVLEGVALDVKNMKGIKDVEIVSFEIVDVLTYQDNINYDKSVFSSDLRKEDWAYIDSVEHTLGSKLKEVAAYVTKVTFLATRKDNKRVELTFFINHNPVDYLIIGKANKKRRFLDKMPNKYPGYKQKENGSL